MLISDLVNIKARSTTRDKNGHFIMTKFQLTRKTVRILKLSVFKNTQNVQSKNGKLKGETNL